MLPTFVIGLREGLEAALIVSIIATFLRRNGISLRSMWIGVIAAVVLSIAVGVTLQVVEENLPQAQQEGMETVIGGIAVVFVTGMILWMRTHARHMKRELETAAEAALGSGTAKALALMAFIAVLREGFETSVFLLSTFQASTSTLTPAIGAVLGILVAIAIGLGIYSGGVRLNLTRFFKYTGVFLVFVAAGLVLSALRTGHEAGWINVGQGRTVDLSWLAPAGAIRTALISGVLGIPADPRVIEVLGWACYLLPVLAITLWPARLKPAAHLVPRLRLAAIGALVAVAAVLFLAVGYPSSAVAASAPLADGGTTSITVDGQRATLVVAHGSTSTTLPLTDPEPVSGGFADTRWHLAPGYAASLPSSIDLTTLLSYTGNRVPVGLDAQRNPGPYTAAWAVTGDLTVLTRDGGLVDGTADAGLLLTLRDGGLTSSRVVSVDDPGGALTWRLSGDYVSATATTLADARIVSADRDLWKHWFPVALVVVAAALLAVHLRRTQHPTDPVPTAAPPAPVLTHTSAR